VQGRSDKNACDAHLLQADEIVAPAQPARRINGPVACGRMNCCESLEVRASIAAHPRQCHGDKTPRPESRIEQAAGALKIFAAKIKRENHARMSLIGFQCRNIRKTLAGDDDINALPRKP